MTVKKNEKKRREKNRDMSESMLQRKKTSSNWEQKSQPSRRFREKKKRARKKTASTCISCRRNKVVLAYLCSPLACWEAGNPVGGAGPSCHHLLSGSRTPCCTGWVPAGHRSQNGRTRLCPYHQTPAEHGIGSLVSHINSHLWQGNSSKTNNCTVCKKLNHRVQNHNREITEGPLTAIKHIHITSYLLYTYKWGMSE